MFRLVRELTGHSFAAFVAGVVYVFSPGHIISYGWTNLWGVQWFPFALLYAVRLLRVGRPWHGIALALTMTLATLTDWHQPALLLLTITVLTLAVVCGRRQSGFVRAGMLQRLLWSCLAYSLLVSPLALLVLKELAVGDTLLKTSSWFKQHELLGYRTHFGDVIAHGVLLGWMSLALAMYGVVRGLDFWMKCFAAMLAAFAVLSLGEGLRLPGGAEPVIPLPFLLWRKLPLLGIMRGSLYFGLMVQVCVAILAGHGVKRLWERLDGWQPRQVPRVQLALGIGLLALILAETLQAPLAPVPVRFHPVYEAIQYDGKEGVILDAPIGYTRESTPHHAGWSMYLQTLHNKPLVGGYTQFDGRQRLAFLDQNPVLKLFTDRSTPQPENIPDGVDELRAFLTQYHVRWIILRKGMRDPACDLQRIPGWSTQKLMTLLAPAVLNGTLQTMWHPPPYCGDWDTAKAQQADVLVRRTVGQPVWDDDELVAYQVR